MTTFDDRERAFENKYAHDAELQFRTDARRNKLLGLWVAEILGKKAELADAYAREVVIADLAEAGDEDVFRKVYGDLTAAGAPVSEQEVRVKMNTLLAEAKLQIMSETGD
jgi:hypothetical protein